VHTQRLLGDKIRDWGVQRWVCSHARIPILMKSFNRRLGNSKRARFPATHGFEDSSRQDTKKRGEDGILETTVLHSVDTCPNRFDMQYTYLVTVVIFWKYTLVVRRAPLSQKGEITLAEFHRCLGWQKGADTFPWQKRRTISISYHEYR